MCIICYFVQCQKIVDTCYVTSLLAPLLIFGARLSVFFLYVGNNKHFFVQLLDSAVFMLGLSIFVVCCFAKKSKTTTWNTSKQKHCFFINCMDFVVVRTKINKK
jgi:ABC-type spermidine/putrescine transport system permease subunit II